MLTVAIKRFLLFILFLHPVLSHSKEKTATIHFDEYKTIAETRTWKWKINGVELSVLHDSVKFPVHYPKPDTIIYTSNDTSKPELIISRFTTGQTYHIIFNGCCMSFDIFGGNASSYPENYKPVWPDTVAMKLENGTVQFKVLNYPDTAMLIGSFGDIYGGYTGGILLSNNSLSQKTAPFLLPYSDYINYVMIGKAEFAKPDTLEEREWYMHEFHIRLNEVKEDAVYTKEFVHFRCRFFNRENLVVVYDWKTGETSLEIQYY